MSIQCMPYTSNTCKAHTNNTLSFIELFSTQTHWIVKKNVTNVNNFYDNYVIERWVHEMMFAMKVLVWMSKALTESVVHSSQTPPHYITSQSLLVSRFCILWIPCWRFVWTWNWVNWVSVPESRTPRRLRFDTVWTLGNICWVELSNWSELLRKIRNKR